MTTSGRAFIGSGGFDGLKMTAGSGDFDLYDGWDTSGSLLATITGSTGVYVGSALTFDGGLYVDFKGTGQACDIKVE